MEMKAEPLKPTKLMKQMVIVSSLAIIVIGALIYRSFAALPFAFGVLITSGLNLYKIRLLESTVQKVVHMDDQEAGKNIVRFQYLLRYFLTAIVLVAVGLISNYTTPPPIYNEHRMYFPVWATLFPNGPESLLSSPLISVWGAVLGLLTLQLAMIIIRFKKFEKDGTEFIEYKDDDDDENEKEDGEEDGGEDGEEDGIINKCDDPVYDSLTTSDEEND